MISSLMLLSTILKAVTGICHAALKRHLLYEFLNKRLPVAKTVEHGGRNAKVMGSNPRESKN